MNNKILITSALPYINGIKHLGNLCGSLLPADIYARYQRARGRDVVFLCGTDEHGTPAEIAAEKAGQPVDTFCAEQHAVQADIYRRFGISTDHFSRTSSPDNHELTQQVFLALHDRGFIEERVTRQIWSEADGRFLPDRYIIGTCPRCGSTSARGDQCESCSTLLDPEQLISPRSALSGSTALEERETKHLFLKQSVLSDAIRTWIDAQEDWDTIVTSTALKWLNEGLEDRCITRDLDWGIPVPLEGYEGKVFYVWFDAPIGYLAALKEWADSTGEDWQSWCRKVDGVRYVQFLAKDNVPFHTLTFPATILGSGLDIRLVDRIKGFNWMTYEGQKFSTSEGRGIFTDQALKEFPADYWRWWLTANAPEGGDVDFTFERFASDVNSDLANTIGNLVNRVLKFACSKLDGDLSGAGEVTEAEKVVAVRAQALVERAQDHYEAISLRAAAKDIRALWALGNEYLSNEAPWTVLKRDPYRAQRIILTTLLIIEVAARLSAPIIPFSSDAVLKAIGSFDHGWPEAGSGYLLQDRRFRIGEINALFPKVGDDRVFELTARFSG